MRTSTSLLAPFTAFLLLGVSNVLAQVDERYHSTFAGCVYDDDNTNSVADVDQETSGLCAEYCAGEGYRYSAFNADGETKCQCSTNYEPGSYIATIDNEQCPENSLNVRIVSTTFYYQGCYTGTVYPEDEGYEFTTNGPISCFEECAFSSYAVWSYSASSEVYMCRCVNEDFTFGTQAPCSPSTRTIFFHDADASASGLARRNLRDRLRRAMRAEAQYCPSGLTACNVYGSEDGYECVDTSSDLEACGGCIHGEFGKSSSVQGQDCTAVGAKLGRSTCLNGHCFATACKRGLTLVDGVCE
ncbi:hypothetical protein I317_04707 [Kwoniella heveanensis CBS 569]|nr:hypothetical protein I317_04707 [Kwoniella heveanensis CBS 569]